MPPSPKQKKPQPAASDHREVIYPELKINGVVIPRRKLVISVEKAKQLLGWEEETAEVKFGPDYLFTDIGGKKIRCTNNIMNRPIYSSTFDMLKQEMLMKRWRFNGEPIIIGKTGQVENGQHTLISLILAEQERTGKQAHKWTALWPDPISIEKLVVLGIEEDDDVVNTMDTCKPRSIADVIYRSEYFAAKKPSDRRACSRMADLAIRLLWQRTGAGTDAFRRTHSEALDFLNRHPKVLAAIKHIYEEDQERSIGKFINTGYASGLLYLMGTSSSDGDTYRLDRNPAPKEATLSFDNWDKALEFWVLLGSGAPAFKEIRFALAALVDPSTGSGGSIAEKTGILIKAWGHFLQGYEFVEGDLTEKFTGKDGKESIRAKLRYDKDDDGIYHLMECPTVGGIDMGIPKEESKKEDDNPPTATETAPEETDEDRKKRLDEQKAKLLANRANGKKDTPTPKKTRKEVEAEQTAKAAEADGEKTPEVKAPPKPKQKGAVSDKGKPPAPKLLPTPKHKKEESAAK